VDWATAELWALGTLLRDGYRVRFSGEDVRRGTFNQRHAILVDTEDGGVFTPLAFAQGGEAFEIVDSPLSEAATVGYEYGFSRDWPDGLVVWEAQFGDFSNGAQIHIDQFLAAGEDKWKLLSGLVLLLPHGFEGQGPEHSSARLERFLQLAAENNLRICQPSTAAQYFHLLRRQALSTWRKPLIVLTPKGLLRADAVASPKIEFTEGRFHRVLPDFDVEDARRVLICSGRIAHELIEEREKRRAADVAIIRLAQLYPFPEQDLREALRRHPHAARVVWVQEEPANMGALAFIKPRLQVLLGGRHLHTVKRTESASPATGSSKAHRMEQDRLLDLAFG
jgi:2-oxoglutarate dehydrogenase E1 component